MDIVGFTDCVDRKHIFNAWLQALCIFNLDISETSLQQYITHNSLELTLMFYVMTRV